MILWILCGLALPQLAGVAPAAKAADKDRQRKEQAKQLFNEGTVLYDLRKFEQAIESFEKAYKAYPNAAFLFNLAQAHRMAGNNADAIGFYNNYLRRLPDAPNAADVKKFIAELEAAPKAAPEAPALPPPPPPQPYYDGSGQPRVVYAAPQQMVVNPLPLLLIGAGLYGAWNGWGGGHGGYHAHRR